MCKYNRANLFIRILACIIDLIPIIPFCILGVLKCDPRFGAHESNELIITFVKVLTSIIFFLIIWMLPLSYLQYKKKSLSYFIFKTTIINIKTGYEPELSELIARNYFFLIFLLVINSFTGAGFIYNILYYFSSKDRIFAWDNMKIQTAVIIDKKVDKNDSLIIDSEVSYPKN